MLMVTAFTIAIGVFPFPNRPGIIFPPDCDEENAQWASAELLSRVRGLALPFPGHGIVSVSVGMAAVLPGPAGSPFTLVRRADEALYNSKSADKDRMELWHEAN